MKRHVTTALLLVALTASASARIGETFPELIARFGKPVYEGDDHGTHSATFVFKDWFVGVELLSGRCAHESYTKSKSSGPVPKGEMSQDDLDVVLGISSRGAAWKPVDAIDYFGQQRSAGSYAPPGAYAVPVKVENIWILSDGSLICVKERVFQADGKKLDALHVFSRAYNEYRGRLAQKEREKQQKGSGL